MSVHYEFDATDGATQVMHCAMRVKGPFEGRRLTLSFPRWTPGSYLIREPLRLTFDLKASARTGAGDQATEVTRVGPCEIRMMVPSGARSVTLQWSQYAQDLSVRTNHLDATHCHMLPSATWPSIVGGISEPDGRDRLVTLQHPDEWTATSQMPLHAGVPPGRIIQSPESENSARTTWAPVDRDALYDGIIEANPNPEASFVAGGRTFRLKHWDAAGLPVRQTDLQRLIEATSLIIEEAHALFGEPPWDDYAIVLHLTGASRGGLEHTGSQTSAVRRTSMDPGDSAGWRDLVSLLSHEYLHAWNVKRLRPREFLDYDLATECHTDLLWWFEGVTSWLGDLICLRSGAWSEKDWIDDLQRKMKRHLSMSGNRHQSLAESSHEAWIHLYRPHCFSNQTTISYYLQGELAAMCLDLGVRRRTKGERGLEDVMLDLWQRHGGLIEGDDVSAAGGPHQDAVPGIVHDDIKRSLNRVSGGRMGAELNRLVKRPTAPRMDEWAAGTGHSFEAEKKSDENDSVLGIRVSTKSGAVHVDGFLPDSPSRDRMQVGDEVVAVNGRRISNTATLKSALRGRSGQQVELLLSRRGGIIESTVTPVSAPALGVRLAGKGNAIWRSMLRSRRVDGHD